MATCTASSRSRRFLRIRFYMGVLRSKRFGLFPGKHEPVVSAYLFQKVQHVPAGKYVRRTRRFFFLFRRFIHCETCGRSLSGSKQKGRAYYRCPTITCPTTSLRDDAIENHNWREGGLRTFCMLEGSVVLTAPGPEGFL
jgi:hypothetical protein